jgi:hypothetical protein
LSIVLCSVLCEAFVILIFRSKHAAIGSRDLFRKPPVISRAANLFRTPPPLQSHAGPNDFHQSEWPCALKKAVGRAEHARHGETKDEPVAALFERVADQHRGDCKQTENGNWAHAGALEGVFNFSKSKQLPAFRRDPRSAVN